MTLIRCVRLSLLSVGLVCLVCTDVHGQQPPETAPTETVAQDETPAIEAPRPGPPQQVAIPVSDIPARADEVAANVRRVEAFVEPQDAVVAIAEAIPDKARQIVELRTALGALDPNRVSVERIADQRVEWTAVERTLTDWNLVLQTRWTALRAERTELRDTECQGRSKIRPPWRRKTRPLGSWVEWRNAAVRRGRQDAGVVAGWRAFLLCSRR